MNLLTEEVRAMIGTRVTYQAPEELGRAAIRQFAIAIGSAPSLWGDVAPPTLVCETTQIGGVNEPDEDTHYLGHSWSLPFPAPCRLIRGGNEYRFGRAVLAQDVITTTWELVEMVERVGDDGVPMVIATAQGDYRSAEGEWLATNIETSLYRPAGGTS